MAGTRRLKRARKRRHAHKHACSTQAPEGRVHGLTHRWKNENKRTRCNSGQGESRTKWERGRREEQFIAFKAVSVDSARHSGQRRVAIKCTAFSAGRAVIILQGWARDCDRTARPARICAVAALIYSNAPKHAPQRGRSGLSGGHLCTEPEAGATSDYHSGASAQSQRGNKGIGCAHPRASQAPLLVRASFRARFSVG